MLDVGICAQIAVCEIVFDSDYSNNLTGGEFQSGDRMMQLLCVLCNFHTVCDLEQRESMFSLALFLCQSFLKVGMMTELISLLSLFTEDVEHFQKKPSPNILHALVRNFNSRMNSKLSERCTSSIIMENVKILTMKKFLNI